MTDDEGNGDSKRQRGADVLSGRLDSRTDPSETSETEETAETSETEETEETEDMSTTSETSETAKTSETAETSETSETSKTAETSKTGGSLKDTRENLNLYLPEDLVTELTAEYSRINAEFLKVHGREMEKNRDWYPAVIEAGLSDKSVEEVLDIAE